MGYPPVVVAEARILTERRIAEDVGTESSPFALVLYRDQDFLPVGVANTPYGATDG